MKWPRFDIIVFIAMMCWVMGAFMAPNLYALGGHGDVNGVYGTFYIPDGLTNCGVCHYTAFTGLPGDSQPIMWVREFFNATPYGGPSRIPPSPNVINFTTFIPDDPLNPVGALVDGNGGGVCEVCHTKTRYYTNSGMGSGWPGGEGEHYPKQQEDEWFGWDCTECHWHFRSGNRLVSQIWFEPNLIGGQSHDTHIGATDLKGPRLILNFSEWGVDRECYVCHDQVDWHLFRDGQDKQNTTVCNECHSTGGEYGGADVAKAAWESGVYDPSTSFEEVKADYKIVWCAHCHDDVPNGQVASAVYGVTAPNVMGDDEIYGYNVNGHGRSGAEKRCSRCHDLTKKHTDRKQRTYKASNDNYVRGYRLVKNALKIPRTDPDYEKEIFMLCFECHDYDQKFGRDLPFKTNFREDIRIPNKNYHYHHLNRQPSIYWDSDWDTYVDSHGSCPACHQVHGSPMRINGGLAPNPIMIRHGELISTPGTTDKVPALDFRWLDKNDNLTSDFLQSRAGRVIGDYHSGSPNLNHVCLGCHQVGDITYDRSPGQVDIVDAWSDKTSYNPGDNITYKVRFNLIGGKGQYFVKAKVEVSSQSGTPWSRTYTKTATKTVTQTKEEYTWSWDKIVPSEASHGSTALVKVTVKIFDQQGGAKIDKDTDKFIYSIL